MVQLKEALPDRAHAMGPKPTMVPEAQGQATEASSHITGDRDAILTGQLDPGHVPPHLGRE